MTIFVEMFQNHIKSEFVKNREFILDVILVIFSQKRQFRLENLNFEISRNSAYEFCT